MPNESVIKVIVDDERLTDDNIGNIDNSSPIGDVNNVGEVGKSSLREIKRALIGKTLITAYGVGIGLQTVNYAINNYAAYTGDYVQQNGVANFRKLLGGMANPVGIVFEQMSLNNSIYKANLKAQELQEITNTSASQVLRSRGRGV
jgi:hypothetical protein